MKIATLILSLMIGSGASAMSLSYKDHVTVKKTVITADLPAEYLNLHRDFIFEEKRMIAGDFEVSQKKKKNFLDGLRSRLQGIKEFNRF